MTPEQKKANTKIHKANIKYLKKLETEYKTEEAPEVLWKLETEIKCVKHSLRRSAVWLELPAKKTWKS